MKLRTKRINDGDNHTMYERYNLLSTPQLHYVPVAIIQGGPKNGTVFLYTS